MTVEAAGSSSASVADAALIGEIAPAMRKKLEDDGFAKGVLVANGLIMVALAIGLQMRDSEFAYRFTVGYAAIAVAGLTLALLPFYLKKHSVAAEISYRRKHGKWRWER